MPVMINGKLPLSGMVIRIGKYTTLTIRSASIETVDGIFKILKRELQAKNPTLDVHWRALELKLVEPIDAQEPDEPEQYDVDAAYEREQDAEITGMNYNPLHDDNTDGSNPFGMDEFNPLGG